MAEYIVSIDNEEISLGADVISMTGKVNGFQCAGKVRISALKKLTKAEQKKLKQMALIEAFEKRQENVPASAGDKVVV